MFIKKISVYLIIIYFSIIFISCNNPSKVDKTTMSKVYVKILVAQETFLPDYKLLEKEKSKIFGKYKITEKDYNYTLSEYGTSEEEWEEFFKYSLAYLDTLRKYNLKK